MPDKAAVVTGATQGIGRGCALALARRGVAVALVDLRHEALAEVVAFLATVTPNFITGEVIDVDGGQWVN